MSSAGIFLICTAAIPFIILLINILLYYYWLNETGLAVIRYKEFKSMFNIAPDKWSYYDDYVRYENNSMYINTLHGLWRAKYDIHKHRNDIAKTESLKQKQQLIKQWQKDIEEYKQNAIEEAKEQLKKTGLLTFTPDQKDIVEAAVLQYLSSKGSTDLNDISDVENYVKKLFIKI